MNGIVSALTGLLLPAFSPAFGQTADPSRQEAVRERSADVMPFDMNATTHIFTKTPEGGVGKIAVPKLIDSVARGNANVAFSILEDRARSRR
jgi:hypothetical protein